jgi:hypothetical protein
MLSNAYVDSIPPWPQTRQILLQCELCCLLWVTLSFSC